MSSQRGDDQYPLLLVVNMRDEHPEKTPFPPAQSVRDRNVTMGAASVLSRWPQHMTTTLRLAMITALTVMSLSLFTVAVVVYMTDPSISSSALFHGNTQPQPKSRRHSICDVYKRQVDVDLADVDALVKYMSPLETAVEFLYDKNKIFFVATKGDLMTMGKQCAIASAARTNPHATIFLLIFIDKLDDKLVAAEGRNETHIDKKVHVIFVNAHEYFKLTPLRAFWNENMSNNSLKTLAAKLVTLWRFGGQALDLNVLSLRAAVLPRPRCTNANMDVNGLILGAKQPCHAFMFQTMMILARMHLELQMNTVTTSYSTSAALAAARDVYCKHPHSKSPSAKRKCQSVNILTNKVVCDSKETLEGGQCVWLPFKEEDVDNTFLKNHCPALLNAIV